MNSAGLLQSLADLDTHAHHSQFHNYYGPTPLSSFDLEYGLAGSGFTRYAI